MASTMHSIVDKETAADGALGTHTAIAAGSSSSARDYGVESSSDDSLDDNYRMFKAAAEADFDPAEAEKVLRKIDLRVVPVLFMTYFLQYL